MREDRIDLGKDRWLRRVGECPVLGLGVPLCLLRWIWLLSLLAFSRASFLVLR